MKESRATFLCVTGLVELVRPPTASTRFGSNGVLWVLTGTHRCDLASRMRLDQSASLTYVFGARGDAVMLDAGIVTVVSDRQHTASSQLGKPWESDQTEDADKSRLESTRLLAGQWCRQGIQQHEGTDVTGTRKPDYSTRRLASLLCPEKQKANS